MISSGLLGRKSGSKSEGGRNPGVDSSSTVLAFSCPLSGLAALDGVTKSQTPCQSLDLALREQRKRLYQG